MGALPSVVTDEAVPTILGAVNILSVLQVMPHQDSVPDGAYFDFIIVGAGSAGSVIANRLTETKSASVILLEAGGDPPVDSVTPGLFMNLKKRPCDWDYESEDDGYSQQFHPNHGAPITKGKMLGGSSSINWMVYTRGNFHDYDTWANITGDDSWNWEHVLPYFIKSERLVDPVLLNSDARPYHGTDGYLGTKRYYNDDLQKYFEAFEEIGHQTVIDTNGKTPLGFTECQFTIDNVRQSTEECFLKPIDDRPNFYLLKNTHVTKVLFDDQKNAIGVEAISEKNTTVTFKANIEVILSAGAISTPQILMLSGIGPAEHLKSHNIDAICDLPVGQTLQDHVFIMTTHPMGLSLPLKSLDLTNFPVPSIMGFTALDKTQTYPDFQTIHFLMREPTPMAQICLLYFSYLPAICEEQVLSVIGKEFLYGAVILTHPESRGRVLLRSTNPKDKPIIYTGYYNKEEDLINHVKYLKEFLRVQESA